MNDVDVPINYDTEIIVRDINFFEKLPDIFLKESKRTIGNSIQITYHEYLL